MTYEAAATFAQDVLDIAANIDCRSEQVLSVALGPKRAELRFASQHLRELFRPSFLAAEGDSTNSAVVTLWDSNVSAPKLPPLPWPKEAYRACGEMRGYSDGRFYIRFDVPMQAITVLDTQLRRGAYFAREPLSLPAYEAAGPIKWLIHRLAVEDQMLFAHCAGVAWKGRAAIVVGPRGAGKSTTALACISAGLDFLGDDRCLISAKDAPAVYAVYTKAKMFAADKDRFGAPAISEGAFRPDGDTDGKLHIPIDQIAPLQLVRSAKIHSILVLDRSNRKETLLEMTGASTATRLLVAEIVGQSPVTTARSLEIASQLCRKVPVRRLIAGCNLDGIAATISSLLGR